MEGLAPSLELLLYVRSSIESGESIRVGIVRYINSSRSSFANEVAVWINMLDSGVGTEDLELKISNPYRKTLLRVLRKGLGGQTILPLLQSLEIEIRKVAEAEIGEFVAKLPIKLLVPLVLLQFPAFLLLIFGPLLRAFLEGLS